MKAYGRMNVEDKFRLLTLPIPTPSEGKLVALWLVQCGLIYHMIYLYVA